MYQSAIVVGEVPTDYRIYYHFFRKTCMTIYVYYDYVLIRIDFRSENKDKDFPMAE